MGFFLGRDCHFFRTSWYFHKIGTRWYFFRTRLSLFLGRVGNLITWDELVTFLGRDGHRLTNLANLKYWGNAFCNYWGGGWGPIIGGIYTPIPPPPPFRHRWLDIVKIIQECLTSVLICTSLNLPIQMWNLKSGIFILQEGVMSTGHDGGTQI